MPLGASDWREDNSNNGITATAMGKDEPQPQTQVSLPLGLDC